MNTHPSLTPVLAPGERLNDQRLVQIRDYKTPWAFEQPITLDEWVPKKERIRRKILISCGLWPMPDKGPVHAEVYEKKEHEDYTVEKVLLETFPGYYATGNLYRPKQDPDKPLRRLPGILCPHGHWGQGRFENTEKCSVPGRCINFARQGYVVFTYDMVGYGDNKAFISHGFGGRREALWGLTPAGFQLYTSIRALDFLCTLPDVEPRRIGCTGASGGGTQTFLLSAVDDRVRVSAPVNMISAHMQGGCKCENPPALRLDLNNMDIGAVMAPREMIMVCATGDWTENTPTVEFPAVQSVYALYDDVESIAYHQVTADHNYNKESREAVYKWFGRFFYSRRPESEFVEKDFVVDATPDLYCLANRAVPENTLQPEALFASQREAREGLIWEFSEKYKASFEAVLGNAYRETLAVSEPNDQDIQTGQVQKSRHEGYSFEKFLLSNPKTGQAVPAHLWIPSKLDPKRAQGAVLLVHPGGKAALVRENGVPVPEVVSRLEAGVPVLAVDCLGTGEYVNDASWTARVKAQEPEGGTPHFETYNLTDAACRVQDILLAESYLAMRYQKPARIVGLAGAGGWALLAHGLALKSEGTFADLSGLEFAEDKAFTDSLYIPNLRKVGDFASSIILGGHRPLQVTGCADEEMRTRIEKALSLVNN
jgi:dienelactone hydrolase